MSKITIVQGNVVNADKNGLIVFIFTLNINAVCLWKDLTDYKNRYEILSTINRVHKFSILPNIKKNKIFLSYKFIHPEEQHNKKKIIPTANHFSNLSSYLNYWIIDNDVIPEPNIDIFKKVISENF